VSYFPEGLWRSICRTKKIDMRAKRKKEVKTMLRCARGQVTAAGLPAKSMRAWISSGWEDAWPQAGASAHRGASMAVLLGSTSHLSQSVSR